MKKTRLYKIIKTTLCAIGFAGGAAQAVPWCHQGTIVQIADVNWGESSIIANFPGSIPGDIPAWVVDVDWYVTFMSIHDYANGFAGGGGGFGGYSVPGSGQVKALAYGPHSYINNPSLYNTMQGVQFKIKKCYTIPPLTVVHELKTFELPWTPGGTDNPISIKPLDRLEELETYWQQPRR